MAALIFSIFAAMLAMQLLGVVVQKLPPEAIPANGSSWVCILLLPRCVDQQQLSRIHGLGFVYPMVSVCRRGSSLWMINLQVSRGHYVKVGVRRQFSHAQGIDNADHTVNRLEETRMCSKRGLFCRQVV